MITREESRSILGSGANGAVMGISLSIGLMIITKTPPSSIEGLLGLFILFGGTGFTLGSLSECSNALLFKPNKQKNDDQPVAQHRLAPQPQ